MPTNPPHNPLVVTTAYVCQACSGQCAYERKVGAPIRRFCPKCITSRRKTRLLARRDLERRGPGGEISNKQEVRAVALRSRKEAALELASWEMWEEVAVAAKSGDMEREVSFRPITKQAVHLIELSAFRKIRKGLGKDYERIRKELQS